MASTSKVSAPSSDSDEHVDHDWVEPEGNCYIPRAPKTKVVWYARMDFYSSSTSPDQEFPEDDDPIFEGENPIFELNLSKTRVTSPWTLNLSRSATKNIPEKTKSVILYHARRTWIIEYKKTGRFRRFAARDWRVFVADSRLRKDDMVIFQVMETNSDEVVKLKVAFLRGRRDLPTGEHQFREPKPEPEDDDVIVID